MKTAAVGLSFWLLLGQCAEALPASADVSADAVLKAVSERVVRVTPFGPPYPMSSSTGYRLDLKPELTPHGDCVSQQLELVMVLPRGYRARHPQIDRPPPGSTFGGLTLVNRFSAKRAPANGPDQACDLPWAGRWMVADDATTFDRAQEALEEIERHLVGRRTKSGSPPFLVRCKENGARCREPLKRLSSALQQGFDRVDLDGGEFELRDGHPIIGDAVVTASRTPPFALNWRLTAKLGPDQHVTEVEIAFTPGVLP